MVSEVFYYRLRSFNNFDAKLYCLKIIRELVPGTKNLIHFLICIVKNMFKFVDKWGRGITGKPITLIEVLICIGVVISVIVGVV